MKYIIVYDIPIEYDPLRTKISNLLLSYCLVRLNYSVFFGDLTRNRAEEIALKIEKILKKVPKDVKCDVRLIPICKKCHDNAITVKSKFGDGYKIIEDILAM